MAFQLDSKASPFDSLPYSCTWRILEHLDVIALRETRVVNKLFRLFSDGDRVWAHHALPILQKEAPATPLPSKGYRALFYQKLKFWSATTLTEGMVSKNNVLESTGVLLNWGTAIVDYPRVRHRKQYCEFLIEDMRKGYLENTHKIVIGLVPENFDVTVGRCIGEGHSFGYIAQAGQKIGGGGSDPMDYAEGFNEGDRVGILADPVANSLSFYLNGRFLGVAFQNFMDTSTRSYQFAVSMIRSHMRVKILSDVPIPSAPYPKSEPVALPVSDFPLNRCHGDILSLLLSHLSLHEVNEKRLVSKTWNAVASAPALWKPVEDRLLRDFEPTLTNSRLNVMKNTMRFSQTARAPGLQLSMDGTSVTSGSEVVYWSAIRMDYPKMNSGVHYAEFQVNVFRHGAIGNTWKLVCGIVSEEFEYALTKWVGVDEKSFGFIAANGKAVGPACKNLGGTYADGYQENDRIGVLVDFPKDQISFYKNGVNLGVAFEKFTKQIKLSNPDNANFYFAVSLARWGMQITCLPDAKCPDRNIPIHQ